MKNNNSRIDDLFDEIMSRYYYTNDYDDKKGLQDLI